MNETKNTNPLGRPNYLLFSQVKLGTIVKHGAWKLEVTKIDIEDDGSISLWFDGDHTGGDMNGNPNHEVLTA